MTSFYQSVGGWQTISFATLLCNGYVISHGPKKANIRHLKDIRWGTQKKDLGYCDLLKANDILKAGQTNTKTTR